MKRLIALFIILFSLVYTNPIDTSPTIYELQIISSNEWKMEINMFDEEYFAPDSFYVKNNHDSAKVVSFERFDDDTIGMGTVYVIDQDDLSKQLKF